jgi:hypothetical protein
MKRKQDFNEEDETLARKLLRKMDELTAKIDKLFSRQDNKLPRYIDQKTVSRKIGRSVRTVYNLRNRHKLPWKKVDGTVYILAEPLEKLFGISFDEE